MERQTTSTQITRKTIQSPYDYYEILQCVIGKGKKMFGVRLNKNHTRYEIIKVILFNLDDDLTLCTPALNISQCLFRFLEWKDPIDNRTDDS